MPEPFVHRHRVTYADCTVGNHVYYGRFPELLEAARGELFRHLGHPFARLEAGGLHFPVRRCSLEFHAPARYDALLRIELRMTEVGRVKLGFGYRILEEGHLLVEAITEHGCVNAQERPARLPEDLARGLRAFLAE